MNDVTVILSRIEQGDAAAANQLLPLVYEELHRLAASQMARERPGQTLEATALVHEAYLRLVDGSQAQHWNSRWHFFAAAAEAMRRILVERARRKATIKHGGGLRRVELNDRLVADERRADEIVALDEALYELEKHDSQAAQLVKLRYFVGFSHQQAADHLQISRRAADRLWSVARAWLFQRLNDE